MTYNVFSGTLNHT